MNPPRPRASRSSPGLGPVLSALLVVSVLFVRGGPAAGEPPREPITRLEFLGEARLAPGREVGGTVLGGISGLTYDPRREVYYGISDDRASRGPARFYTFRVTLGGDGGTGGVAVAPLAVTPILDLDGEPFAEGTLDGEGIARTPAGTLFISSEGDARAGVAPFVREIGLDGAPRRALEIPPGHLPAAGSGVRSNLAFEALTLTPAGDALFAATENALVQDGPAADLDQPSATRLLRYNPASGQVVAQYLYVVEPVAEPPVPADGFRVNGLVELLALDGETLLALERSYSAGGGNTLRLYLVSLAGAEDVSAIPSLVDAEVRPVDKTLLADLSHLGLRLDNLEGMTFGPELAGGRRALVLVSDDNFSPLQVTQFLAFAISDEPVTLEAAQGAGARSPLEGAWVRGVEGVVTAVEDGGFWMESPRDDGDPATSRALFVSPDPARPAAPVTVGDGVVVAGRVMERARPGELPLTTLARAAARVVSRGNEPPDPTLLGAGATALPATDMAPALALLESLEGMRVAVPEPVVVGPTTGYGGIAVLAAGGGGADPRSARGGLVLRPDDPNPERLLAAPLDRAGVPGAPPLNVGDRLASPLVGVLGYRHGAFQVLVEGWPEPIPRDLEPETTELLGGRRRLTVATYNVLNLSARNGDERFRAVAESIARDLGGPDIVALQEMQDDTGPADDGVTTARETFARLIAAIVEAGGPRYAYRQIDPVDGADGGQPGGNIRVGYLFNPRRVSFVDRGDGGATDAVAVAGDGRRPRLTLSPGRLAPDDPCFAAEEPGAEGARKSLAAEFRFRRHTLFLVNNHLKSKRGDDPVHGERQPPLPVTEVQRRCQARRVAAFAAEILTRDEDAAVIVLGDMNEHEFRAPLRLLAEEGGLINLIERLPPEDRYTYVYQGNSQVLDHILVSPALARRAAPEVDVVHLNAEYAAGSRASDHDPVLLRLDFDDL